MKAPYYHRIRKISRRRLMVIGGGILLVGLIYLGVRILPANEHDMKASVCRVYGISEWCVTDGQDTVAVTTDSVVQQGVWINRHWWWPSCDGRVLTVVPHTEKLRSLILSSRLSTAEKLTHISDTLRHLYHRKQVEQRELTYYLRSHGVQDEGYIRIAEYADIQKKYTDSLKNSLKSLNQILSSGKKGKLIRCLKLKVSWFDEDDRLQDISCHAIRATVAGEGSPIIVNTMRNYKPWSAYAVRRAPWGGTSHRSIITVTLSPLDSTLEQRAVLTRGNCRKTMHHDLPTLFACEGAAVFSLHGQFIGVVSGREIRR